MSRRVVAFTTLIVFGAIAVPVLVIHGGGEHETPPDHSRRVFEAVRSRKRLIIVPDAGHSRSLDGEVWNDIDRWIDDALQ